MRKVIIHTHIFKNAGTSLDSSLLENFGESFIDHREDLAIRSEEQKYLESYLNSHSDINAFSSHSIFFHPKNSNKYRYFNILMLRHPIERIKSVYIFEKNQKTTDTRGSLRAKELAFPDCICWYLKEDSPGTIRNAQTIFMSGDGPDRKNMYEKYKKAFSYLIYNSFIGIVDRYDESMVLFEDLLRDHFPGIDLSYTKKNVSQKNSGLSIKDKLILLEEELGNEIILNVNFNNKYDLSLYEQANILLTKRIEGVEDFEKKLINFKYRCSIKENEANSRRLPNLRRLLKLFR